VLASAAHAEPSGRRGPRLALAARDAGQPAAAVVLDDPACAAADSFTPRPVGRGPRRRGAD